jgi:hypothetical protein
MENERWWENTDIFQVAKFHGRPAQVEKFSKVKIFQKQFQCSSFQVGLPLDGFR